MRNKYIDDEKAAREKLAQVYLLQIRAQRGEATQQEIDDATAISDQAHAELDDLKSKMEAAESACAAG